jgi:hypothetical protein
MLHDPTRCTCGHQTFESPEEAALQKALYMDLVPYLLEAVNAYCDDHPETTYGTCIQATNCLAALLIRERDADPEAPDEDTDDLPLPLCGTSANDEESGAANAHMDWLSSMSEPEYDVLMDKAFALSDELFDTINTHAQAHEPTSYGVIQEALRFVTHCIDEDMTADDTADA